MKNKFLHLIKPVFLTALISLGPGVASADAVFLLSTGDLAISNTCVPNFGVFDARLRLINQKFDFELETLREVVATNKCDANYRFDTNSLNITRVTVPSENGEDQNFEVELGLIPNTDPLQFSLKRAVVIALNSFAQFKGSYEGTFSGDAKGTFLIQIDENGIISGTTFSIDDGSRNNVSGKLDERGDLVLTVGSTDGGATFSGNIISNTIQGRWEDRGEGETGSFSGQKL